VAPCNRLRRFLRPGLGLGFSQMIRSLSVSVRLSRHTDRGYRVSGVGVKGRHGCLLVPLARIPKQLRFYEDATKVV